VPEGIAKLRKVDAASVFEGLVSSPLAAWRRSAQKGLEIAALAVLLGSPPAWAFDYTRYEPTDFDALLAQPRPRSGVDIYRALPLKLKVTLVAYAEGCPTALLKKSMITGGAPKAQVDALLITSCIKVRSAQGKEHQMFIQDVVASFLPKEVPLDTPVTLLAIHVFTATAGPGLLVNEFMAEPGGGDK
jgi:hypothetical protein